MDRLPQRRSPAAAQFRCNRLQTMLASLLALDAELPKVMIEMPVLQDIPVTWPHPPETGMDHSKPVRRCRDEAFDQFDHDLPIALPTETWCAERARRRLDLPFRLWQAVDGQVSQDRSTNSPGRRTFDFPLAQSHTQATC